MSGHPEGCRCWMCQGGMMGCRGGSCGHHGHWLLRLIIAIAVITFVFALGVKLGELKATFGSYGGYRSGGWGYPMMMQGGYNGGYGCVMLRSGTLTQPAPSQVVPQGSTQAK